MMSVVHRNRQHYVNFRKISGPPKSLDTPPTGAGIIPFMVKDDKVFVLLGKERFVNNWRGSLCWSGFEGGNKNTENCEQNASREFIEETLCIFGSDQCKIEGDLSTYSLRICFTFTHKELFRYHITFVKQFYDNAIDNEWLFAQTRNYIMECHSLSVIFEQNNMMIYNKYPYFREGGVIYMGTERYIVVRVLSIEIIGVFLLTRIELLSDENNTIIKKIKYKFGTENPYPYLKWFQSRERLQELLNNPPNDVCMNHPSVSVTRNLGVITEIRVNVDYLEKVEIKWWSLGELTSALEDNADMFRPYFIPVIKTIISEFG